MPFTQAIRPAGHWFFLVGRKLCTNTLVKLSPRLVPSSAGLYNCSAHESFSCQDPQTPNWRSLRLPKQKRQTIGAEQQPKRATPKVATTPWARPSHLGPVPHRRSRPPTCSAGASGKGVAASMASTPEPPSVQRETRRATRKRWFTCCNYIFMVTSAFRCGWFGGGGSGNHLRKSRETKTSRPHCG